jgi:hypothetical protein
VTKLNKKAMKLKQDFEMSKLDMKKDKGMKENSKKEMKMDKMLHGKKGKK